MSADGTPGNALAGRVIAALGEHAAHVAGQVDRMLSPIGEVREELRSRLLDDGAIIALPDHPSERAAAAIDDIIAVDGAFVAQALYACDLIVAVATSAPGMRRRDGDTPFGIYAEAFPRTMSRDALAKLAMFSLELGVNAQATAAVKVVDGTLATPVIGVMTSLAQAHQAVTPEMLTFVGDRALIGIDAVTDPSACVVGLPKADTSGELAQRWSALLGRPLPPMDRIIATQVLRPGEYLRPWPLKGLAAVSKPGKEQSSAVSALLQAIEQRAMQYQTIAAEGRHVATYVKPRTSPDTVIKVEFFDGHGQLPVQDILTVLDADTPGPHLQEPFCQYLADVSAKTVSLGSDALRAGLLDQIPRDSTYLPYVMRDYRTSKGTGRR